MSTPTWFSDLLDVSDVLAAKDSAGVAAWRGEPADAADAEDAADSEAATEGDPDDVPPLTVRLGDLATAFADRAAELTSEQKQRVLGILEEVQRSGSEYDSTAVATGFFEALLDAGDDGDDGFDLQAVWEYVGPRSRAHCLAWNEFTGVETPDWMR